MNGLQSLGKTEFSCTIPDDGHFEKGKWVSWYSPLMDLVRETPEKEQTFELTGTVLIPLFKQGVHVADRQETIYFGIITKSELKTLGVSKLSLIHI